MMGTLLTKTLYDKRWFILGWSLANLGMIFLVMAFYPSFSQDGTFEEIAKNAPPQFREIIGDPSTFKTIPGYIAQQIYEIRVPLFLMIMSIILGLSLTIAEEEKGTLRTLLATPLSRIRIVIEKWLGAMIVMAVVSLAAIAGTFLGLLSIGESADAWLVSQLGIQAWIFGSAAVAIPLGIGLASGNRGLTMAVTIAATIGSFILSSFGAQVDWLEPIEKFSLLHYYDANAIVDSGIPLADVLVLSGIFFVMLLAALLLFRRRDVA